MIEWQPITELCGETRLIIVHHGNITLPVLSLSNETWKQSDVKWGEIPRGKLKVLFSEKVRIIDILDVLGVDYDASPTEFYDITGFVLVFDYGVGKYGYFEDEDHLSMTILKYPEIFVGMEVV